MSLEGWGMIKVQSAVRKKDGGIREGRGFSRDELRKAGVGIKQALKMGIPIDQRRKTKHEENVKTLKKHLRSLAKKRKRKARTVKKS
ncbi:MAG: ribosomal protein L13e [Candidatus Bathyarchaeota archaeon]|nr:ribosomal protein L13e [Candidatus Bathyarchaeota archaeon]MDH5712691.1 ribosomal protein L13e [Candidatus Bathyarchaeota archaeon]